MDLTLKRTKLTNESTIGELLVNDTFECYTLEDVVREIKIPGKTAIPAGRYKVVVDFSNRYQKMMPHILNVPGFEGVRIHAGNWAKDTEGCILLGTTKGENYIGQSKDAFDKFFKKLNQALQNKEEVYLEIV